MEKKIAFHDRDNTRLIGILTAPQKDILYPIVIMCHGLASSKESKSMTELAKMLEKKNIAAFRFDFYGHGESEGKIENLTLTRAITNCQAAIKLIKDMGYKKIGLAGTSFGGAASIIVASKRHDLSFLCLKAPVCHYKLKELITKGKDIISEWKKRGYIINHSGIQGRDVRINYSFFLDISKYDGYKAATSIRIPAIIIHGSMDTTVPVQQSIKAARLIKGSELHIIEGAGHRFAEDQQFKKVNRLLYDFIVRQCNTR